MEINRKEIDRAIAHGEFVPYFQPLVHLRTGELQGFEMLARWHHRRQRWIPPVQFIPIAERDDCIGPMTQLLLRQAFTAMRAMPPRISLSINISPVQLHDTALAEQIAGLAAENGFSLEQLIVEVTETALADDVDRARKTVEALKLKGCKLALDDFGTGYSSLKQLNALPFDELKIDRSFVSTMLERRDSRKIVAAVVGLGQSLGMQTAAEGVERREQAEKLRWMGCDLGQGWLFGEPVPAHALRDAATRTWSGATAVSRSEPRASDSTSGLEWQPSQRLAHLQAVYDGAPVGLAFLDREMRYVYLNRRLANMNGRPLLEHLGRTVEEMIPEFFAQVEPFITRALGGESITGVELTKPAAGPNPGRTVLLTYEPARDEAGEVVGVSVAMIDVTPMKQAQQALRTSEEHFRYMLELLPHIPWIIDPEGRALDVSRRWLELTGTRGDEWRGFGWLKSLHPDDVELVRAAMQHSFATLEPIDVSYRVRRSPEAEWKRLRARGAPRLDAEGRVVCWYGSLEGPNDVE
ncbi:MAG TPA: EAL domain-containing protein [Terracidiphilus sp.]|nr:EAL domain-containing protein [Terracidiphilus sp.]